jgi:hypothetical protein
MTQHSPRARHAHRRAIAAFLAAAALPATALAQETVTPPTVLVPSQQAPVLAPAPAPQAQTPTGESRTRIAPGVAEAAEQEARERAATARTERAAARPQPQRATRPAARAEAPVRPVEATAPAITPEPTAPIAAAPEPSAPAEAIPAPVETVPPVEATVTPEAADTNGGSLWLILAAVGLAVAAIAALLMFRRRRDDEVEYEPYPAESEPVTIQPEPVIAPAPRVADPVAAAPIFVAPRYAPEIERTAAPVAAENDEPQPSLENAELVTPDPADIKAVLGGAVPQGGRPQLELAMRPTRAGMSRRGAMVEFELTVANAGGLPAEDVRIGAFMLGGNAAAPSEIERLLMHPPADQVMPAERIEPGAGTRLNAAVTLPREQVDAGTLDGDEGFTPVLVADARYRLPDGSEGRTAAAFTIGRVNGGEHLVPIALQDDPAMYADIEARLHSVPAKV